VNQAVESCGEIISMIDYSHMKMEDHLMQKMAVKSLCACIWEYLTPGGWRIALLSLLVHLVD
jgi:hypothetical protein